MKHRIGYTAWLVSPLVCSHAIEHVALRRREQVTNDTVFVNAGFDEPGFPCDIDCGNGVYGGPTLPPTLQPTLQPTLPPSLPPTPDSCEKCGNTFNPFDFVAFKSDIAKLSAEFIEKYEMSVLDPTLCEPENSRSCLQYLADQRTGLEQFTGFVATSMVKFDVIICEQIVVGPVTPECSLEGLDVPVVRTPDSRRLEIIDVDGVEGDVRQVRERELEDTLLRSNLFKGLRDAFDLAESIVEALPECGGFVTGDACSAGVTAVKIGFVTTLSVAKVALTAFEIDLANREDRNGGISFEFSLTTHDNLIEAHRKLDKAIQKLDEANEKLDKLLCPFGNNGPDFTVLRQGCDSVDQNCNGVVDECAEDNVPPSIALNHHLPDIPFKSIEDAREYLINNVIVSDDCAVQFQTTVVLESDRNCCDCQFRVTAADERCAEDNQPGNAVTSKSFVLKVDSTAPVVTCGFFTQQDPFHVSGGFDPCDGLPVPYPGENDPLHIDQTCFGQDLLDVALWYQIEDECDKGVLPVTVRVLSNELEGRPVDDKMTLIVERNDLPNAVHRARVYLSPTSCQDDTTNDGKGSNGSGNGASIICEIEETEDDTVTTRFYDIIVSATDAAGNVGSKVCVVIVVPQDDCEHGKGAGGLQSKKQCGGSKSSKVIQNGGQRGEDLDSAVDFSGRNLQRSKKSAKSSKDLVTPNENNPDRLRTEYALSTQRYVISELSLEWDPNLDTALTVPPLPDSQTNPGKGKGNKTNIGKGKGSKSGQRSCATSCEGATGAKGKKGKGKTRGELDPNRDTTTVSTGQEKGADESDQEATMIDAAALPENLNTKAETGVEKGVDESDHANTMIVSTLPESETKKSKKSRGLS